MGVLGILINQYLFNTEKPKLVAQTNHLVYALMRISVMPGHEETKIIEIV